MWGIEMGIALAVFAVVALLLAVGIVRGRRAARAGRQPASKSERHLLEGGYVVLLVGMAIFLVWNSLSANAQESGATAKPAVVVKVWAHQWCWRFQYPAQHFSVSGTCVGGHDLPTLVLPTGRPVELEVTSTDVVHEISVPYLRYRVEAFPDHVNYLHLTLDRTGRWIGRCSEFCGLYHAYMDFWLRGVTPSAYHQWLGQHRAASVS